MAELKLISLSDSFSQQDLKKLYSELKSIDVTVETTGEDSLDEDEIIEDDRLLDFFDRLDAHDIACDIYIPVEFDTTFEVGDRVIGSGYQLQDALEEISEELDLDNRSPEDELQEEGEMDMIEAGLAESWASFSRSVGTSIDRGVPLHVLR